MDFHPRLTVIYGASETGKSFVVEAIDYMFGAGKLKEIQEAQGYTDILLGLRLADGQAVTLVRQPGLNRAAVYHGDFRTVPTTPPAKVLPVKHNPRSDNSLSRYLLKILQADGRQILKSARPTLRSLSFRDLAHLCIVSEGQMAGSRSPVLPSGQRTSETGEKSVFKYMLTGQDESGRVVGPTDVEKKVGKGKVALLTSLIDEARNSLAFDVHPTELERQLGQLEQAVAAASVDVDGLLEERRLYTDTVRGLENDLAENHRSADETRILLGRFGLLRQQYESDLARLEMVAEAGNLLGYFHTGTCVFCGAAPEHQQPGHNVDETTELHAAVGAELRKTIELRTDLLTTIEDLTGQLAALGSGDARLRAQVGEAEERLAVLSVLLAPLRTDTSEMLTVRTKIQRDLTIHAQIERLEELKADFLSAPTPVPARQDGISSSQLAEFEELVQQVLSSWQVPGDNAVNYDEQSGEISVGGRERHSRGKGMRSIIHAAFSTALVHYTMRHDRPHPGFVVLDSPVLTYREPDEVDIALTHNVVEHFYRGLLEERSAQIVVVENGDPPEGLGDDVTTYAFGTSGSTRLGFFPPQNPTVVSLSRSYSENAPGAG
ncbi:hypothetical protein [Catenulispora sp. MAP12-49]|uniref:hypothetical protein n=1 Tax=Catenulispora sp. MAP12-49 TaxID=3156302 RepID=UPI0035121E98